MTDIDWKNAPEGYPIWIQDLRPEVGADLSGWHRKESDRYYDQEGSHWMEENEGKWFTVHRNVDEWSGEGLPPIGSACEMISHGEEESEWIEVQILAHTNINGEDHAVFQYEEYVGTGSVQGSCFRPVRTDQERGVDLVLSEIEALYAEGGPAAIYGAGYRKVEGGAE